MTLIHAVLNMIRFSVPMPTQDGAAFKLLYQSLMKMVMIVCDMEQSALLANQYE